MVLHLYYNYPELLTTALQPYYNCPEPIDNDITILLQLSRSY